MPERNRDPQREAELDAAAARLVAQLPPLSDAAIEQLAELLPRPARDRHRDAA